MHLRIAKNRQATLILRLSLVLVIILFLSGCCCAPSRIDKYVGRIQFGRVSRGCSAWSSALSGNSVGLQRNEGILKGKTERFTLIPVLGVPFRFQRARNMLQEYPYEMVPEKRRILITLASSNFGWVLNKPL